MTLKLPTLALGGCALPFAALFLATVVPFTSSCSPASGSTPRRVDLPQGWSSAHSSRFEKLLDENLPLGTHTELAPAALDELRVALDGAPGTATRAALWLARAANPAASEILLAHIEERHSGPDRADDVGDATAATALGRAPLAKDTIARLTALAVGERPHPDIEVRVECALAALDHGDRSVVPLLIRVLRIDTPSEARDGELTDSPTTAWVRGRADRALTALLGATYRDRTDAPYAEREAWADELEVRLAAR